MTSPLTGWAIWPSGNSWLVLATNDGWRSTENVTPAAVPTGGGFVLSEGDGRLAVAVGAYDRLTQSPLLVKDGTAMQWQPEELPGAVIDDRDAVSVVGGQISAIISRSGGTVTSADGAGWRDLITGPALNASGDLQLDTVTWANASFGWVTGHASAGTPQAFRTIDAGHTWVPVPLTTTTAVAVLAPCGVGKNWLLPAIDANGMIIVERTVDAGQTWSGGRPIALTGGTPAWGCIGNTVWMAGRAGTSDHLFVSADGGQTWSDRGATPSGLTDLVPEADGNGYAVSRKGDTATMWTVADGGSRFTAIALPPWIATLGSSGTDS